MLRFIFSIWAFLLLLTHPLTGAPHAGLYAGADLAPANTIFYSETPSVAEFNQNFFYAHNSISAHPLVGDAVRAIAGSPLINPKPVLPAPPLAIDFAGTLYAMTPNHLFTAFTPAPKQGMLFLSGGQMAKPDVALAELQAATLKKIPTLKWSSTTSGPITLTTTTIPGVGGFQLAAGNGWLLIGTDTAAMAHAVQVIRLGKADADSLSSTTTWKENFGAHAATPLLLYFSRLDRMAQVAQSTGLQAQAELLRTRFSGATALSWSWNTGFADRKSFDRFVVTLQPKTAAEAARLLVPLKDPMALSGPDTVFHFAIQTKINQLLQTPLFTELVFSRKSASWIASLQLPPKSADQPLPATFLLDHAPNGPRSAWVILLPPEAKVQALIQALREKTSMPKLASLSTPTGVYLVVADDVASSDYFIERLKQKNSGASKSFVARETLPLLDRTFLALRIDRARIVKDLMASYRKDSAASMAALKRRGVVSPESYVNFDPETILGPMQMSACLAANNLIVDNYFLLKNSNSTAITMSTIISLQVYGPHIEGAIQRWKDLLRADATQTGTANPYAMWAESYFLFGPLLTQTSAYSLGTDIFAHLILAQQPSIP